MMGESYVPELARGLRWDDPAVGIAWPLPDPFLSERDLRLPSLTELRVSHRIFSASAGIQ